MMPIMQARIIQGNYGTQHKEVRDRNLTALIRQKRNGRGFDAHTYRQHASLAMHIRAQKHQGNIYTNYQRKFPKSTCTEQSASYRADPTSAPAAHHPTCSSRESLMIHVGSHGGAKCR
jgi:hypothetical protein